MQGLPASRCAELPGNEGAYCRSGDDSTKLGEEIHARNAEHTLFLTKYGEHDKTSVAVHEGDIICWLLQQPAMYSLHKVDDTYWNLVGQSNSTDFPEIVQLCKRISDSRPRLVSAS